MFRFFAKETVFDFMGKRWIGFAVSGLMVFASLFFIAVHGFNWGIDFTGGVLMELRTEQPADLQQMREMFSAKEYGEVSLQQLGNPNDVMLRLELAEGQDQAALIEKVKAQMTTAHLAVDYRKIDYVGPAVGRELIQGGVISLALAMLGIMLYVWMRFEWQYGVGGIIALLHDLVFTLGFFAFSGYEFGLSSIAALLTILGYSINDSVVLFDRVRDMRRKYKKMPMEELLNKSINLNLGRTLMTSGTTILAALALVVGGGEVLRSFSAAILFGLVVGTYSSIYMSVPVLIYLRLADDKAEDDAQNGAEIIVS
jgi:preprotein translocase subunit SecF